MPLIKLKSNDQNISKLISANNLKSIFEKGKNQQMTFYDDFLLSF